MALFAPPYTLHHADCLPLLASLPDDAVDAIITDPPYFRVKSDAWDRQWRTADAFAVWMGRVLDQFARILKPSGSLYLFASPAMAARVEMLIAERLQVLNHIVWAKPSGKHLGTCRASQRRFFPQTERILFAEHYGADSTAEDAAGYKAKCAALRRTLFEPLRRYLDDERQRAGWRCSEIDAAWRVWRGTPNSKGGMATHWFSRSQWAMPTPAAYAWLQQLFRSRPGDALSHPAAVLGAGHAVLRTDYHFLKKEYDTLKQQYQALCRPFAMDNVAPHTDVWHFPVVQPYAGKHPCEKPLPLMRHIMECSTRPGHVVLDPFLGSGSTGIAALEAGCRFVGIEQDAVIHAQAAKRLADFVGAAHTSASA
ncbi:DNA-methyltransferase [Chitinimonas sp. BJB300]|uniref:DNA-methyltransferase n=1 Tax=Chitinimonas sp. BJB300 TaxID=1559339 RepID=UPI000C0D7664|nr:site-specific DNA-methyltransferase [Chitinimonas sp. BJB300]PHV11306.1 DNA adenine methylase [Chitinimonas sp. BJB300]TSJ88200.1 site-specific DNA-methyltransferase [Chitinimonas sp. BJB300]